MLPAAAAAFDAVAERFDERFGAWQSVAAQRRAVRACLLEAFAPGSRILEIGGGTGEDAEWLAQRGRYVQHTDVSPSMVRVATERLKACGLPLPVVADAEHLEPVAQLPFDGAFSNFAALNCVADLSAVARGLSRAVQPGGRAVLVMFGTFCPGEWLVEAVRGRPRAAVRRFSRGNSAARLGGHAFEVIYHRGADVVRAFAPTFRLVRRRGIGVFVPPSAAEPWITAHPRVLGLLAGLDAALGTPLASLGDHVLYDFERTEDAE